MHSLDAANLDGLLLSAEQASTLAAIAEHRGKQNLYRDQAPEVLEALLKTAIIESSESSNRLEGILARRSRPFGISEIEAECPGVSREMVRHILRRLRDTGKLRVDGRGARWVPLGD